ncbi:MAG: OmpH family outer membrane protein [Bacteroidales bacterium]|nr:OmpH family outer membrane protein [Bacteroidales bacterium]MDD4669705.1 OmpH family outer membrane protein [Bacteroidales bacterium]
MKKTPLILSIVAVVLAAAVLVLFLAGPAGTKKSQKGANILTEGSSAVAGDIVYVQIDTLIMQYDYFNDLRSAFESKAQTVQDDLQKQGRKLESDGKAFENQINKGLLTRSVAEQQQQGLLKRQQDLQNLANQKQMELQEEEYVLNNKVMDAIKTFLEEYNKTHDYAMILTTSTATNIVIVGNPALDITQDVVAGLNEEYIKNRNSK